MERRKYGRFHFLYFSPPPSFFSFFRFLVRFVSSFLFFFHFLLFPFSSIFLWCVSPYIMYLLVFLNSPSVFLFSHVLFFCHSLLPSPPLAFMIFHLFDVQCSSFSPFSISLLLLLLLTIILIFKRIQLFGDFGASGTRQFLPNLHR